MASSNNISTRIDRDKTVAERRLLAVTAVVELREAGLSLGQAYVDAAILFECPKGSIERWYYKVKEQPREKWLDLLTSKWGCGRPVEPIPETAIALMIRHYLCPEAPTWKASYERVRTTLKTLNDSVPGSKKLRAEINRRYSKHDQQSLRKGVRN